jgi:hypothetical protein
MLGVVGQLPHESCVGKERGVNAGVKQTVGPCSCPIKSFGQQPLSFRCQRISPLTSFSGALLWHFLVPRLSLCHGSQEV